MVWVARTQIANADKAALEEATRFHGAKQLEGCEAVVQSAHDGRVAMASSAGPPMLPEDVLNVVFAHLAHCEDVPTLLSARRACRGFRQAADAMLRAIHDVAALPLPAMTDDGDDITGAGQGMPINGLGTHWDTDRDDFRNASLTLTEGWSKPHLATFQGAITEALRYAKEVRKAAVAPCARAGAPCSHRSTLSLAPPSAPRFSPCVCVCVCVCV